MIKIGGMERIERVVVMLSTSEKQAARERAGLASLSAWVRSLILREVAGNPSKPGYNLGKLGRNGVVFGGAAKKGKR